MNHIVLGIISNVLQSTNSGIGVMLANLNDLMLVAYSGDTDPLFRSKLTPQQGVVAACYSLTILLFFSHALTF